MHLDNVEDLYPLAPAQQGILFHTQATSTPTYLGQLAFTFLTRFDERQFELAWRRLIERHAVLRTFFVWERVDRPLQVVRKRVDISIERHDWRTLKGSEDEEFDRLLETDRRRGLDLHHAPVMRLILILLANDRYRFVWTHHHILLDGWSVPLLLSELFSLYDSGSRSAPPRLQAPRAYRDYIVWIAQKDPGQAKNYWRNMLKGFHSPFAISEHLPIARDVVADGWEHEIVIGDDLYERLREYGRKNRVTANTILQGAWAILLSRYTDQTDIVYGATVSGRPPDLDGADRMIGLFINTLPVRAQVDDTLTVAELLRQIQTQQAESREFEYSALVDVQQCSEVPRGSALFDTILVFENYPNNALGNLQNAGNSVGDWRFHAQTNYPLTLVAAISNGIVLRCLHDPSKITPSSAVCLLQHLRRVIESIVIDGDPRVGQIEALTSEERHRSTHIWNEAAAVSWRGSTIPELFAVQVRENPGRIALVDDNESLTYRELELRSNQMARYLQTMGAAPECIVALHLNRGIPLIIAMLGALKAGAAYLPLDVTTPKARLDAILVDCQATLVVTTSAHAGGVAHLDCPVAQLDLERGDIEKEPSDYIGTAIAGENLAYVIYTSGSTGRPKGVMVEHRSVVNLVHGQVQAFHISPDSRTLQFASPTFDASVSEIFCALLSGSALHLGEADALGRGDGLIQLLRTREISVLTLPPSVLAVLPNSDLPNLSTLVVAGEACPAPVVAKWAPGRRFLNAYGPTETTVCATVTEALDGREPVHIGTPLANACIYILDSGLRPVPPGAAGQIYVGGAALARGYVNNPAITAERFLPNPFSAPGCRMYRTGDRARHLLGGQVEYLGRVDFQVKLRGFRVELGEIESCLERDPTVSQACVLARDVAPNVRRLVAYVTPRLGQKPDPGNLLAALRAELPHYAVPSALIVLEAFPLSSTGKIARADLPVPEDRGNVTAEFVAASNDTERCIAAVWREILAIESVGIHDNFFDLGGHSLALLQVHGRLKTLFTKEISVVEMFGFPTVALLAKYFSHDATLDPDTFALIHARASRAREALNLRAQDCQ